MAVVSRYTVSVYSAVLLLTSCFAEAASGAPASTDVYRVQYFRNANTEIPDGPSVPDQEVDIVDPGTNWPSFNALASEPDICADIYVVDPDEELQECCGCLLTPDQLFTLSVNNQLTNNAGSGGPFINNGVIKIISSAPAAGNTCDPRFPKPTPALREWITHVTAEVFSPFLVTEQDFLPATLSAGELSFLSQTCQYIVRNNSGRGQCSCTPPQEE